VANKGEDGCANGKDHDHDPGDGQQSAAMALAGLLDNQFLGGGYKRPIWCCRMIVDTRLHRHAKILTLLVSYVYEGSR
jgi:hypothetical protein